MKKSMPEFITALSDNNFDVLEEIFLDKFLKFSQLYWLLKDYSDYITSLSYKETKKDKLKVEVTFAKLKMDKILSELNESISEDANNILIWNNKKILHIEITRDESTT